MPDSQTEEIKRRIDIVDFIGQYVQLKQTGQNWKGLCPFHNEKTGSFMVHRERQIYRCFGCFVSGTKVITDSGLCPIENISRNDMVATHKARYQKVLHCFRRSYTGAIIKCVNRQMNWPILMTPNHKLFAIQTKLCKQASRETRICQRRCNQRCPSQYFLDYKIVKIRADQLKTNDYLLYPIDTKVDDLKKINLYSRMDYLINRRNIGAPAKYFPEIILANKNLLRFLGYWIAEGSTYSRGVRFSLGSHEMEFAQEIIYLTNKLFKLFAKLHIRKGNKNGLEISVSNTLLAKLIVDLCGHGAANKKIPAFCMRLSKYKQSILIDAIHKGDGTTVGIKNNKVRTGRKSITTISETLALQIRNLLLRQEITPSIQRGQEKIDKKGVKHRKYWTVSWLKNKRSNYSDFIVDSGVRYWLLPIRSIETVDYHGYVYNLMVKGDHSYVVDNFSVGNCGEAGDIFDFVQKHEGMDFYDSLKLLAERAGVILKTRDPREARQQQESKTELLELNKTLADLYHKLLVSHKAGAGARQYISGRKISEDTVKKFQIGYAPNNVARVKDYLNKMGFSDKDLAAAGNPERFRNRLMFPIADIIGNTVGFSGRALEKGQEPKYLNTRETPIFHKAKILYGFDLAKKEIRERDAAILVEGQMDVVLSHQASINNTVATSGTALTEDHLQIIRRQTQNICFAFDADDAGFKTTIKAVEMAWRQGLTVKIIVMPEGYKDAGETVEKDPALWTAAVEKALPAYDWLWQKLSLRYPPQSTSGKKQLANIINPLIAAVSDPVEKDDYIRRFSKGLNVGEGAVRDGLGRARVSRPDGHEPTQDKKDQSASRVWLELLALMYLVPEKISDVEKALHSKLGQSKVAKVYESVFEWYNKPQATREADFLKILPEGVSKKVVMAASELENQESDKEALAKDLDGRLQQILAKMRESTKTDFAQKIAEAEKSGNIKQVQKLMKELQKKIT